MRQSGQYLLMVGLKYGIRASHRRCASEDVGSPKGWIVRFQIGWREVETFHISVWKPLLVDCHQGRWETSP